MQLEMALSAESRVNRGENAVGVELIDVKPRPIDRILPNWREAQIRFEIAQLGSADAETAASDIERFREEYQAAHELLMAGDDGTLAEGPSTPIVRAGVRGTSVDGASG
jgi:hypothetical protein